MNKKIIVSVISDLVTDQRVLKECSTLYSLGYQIILVGRKSTNTFGLSQLPYKVKRLWDPFGRGALMYGFFNFQLFFFLLFQRADILWANDLDTLLPNYLIARLKKKKIIYDSHEYFLLTVAKKSSLRIFGIIERSIFPRLKNVLTVNASIKNVYEKMYKVPITVIRNVPFRNTAVEVVSLNPAHKEKRILLMQGIGLNENRGAEEAVEMMQFLPDLYILYFIGRGTILDKLKKMVEMLGLNSKVFFLGVLPYNTMMGYTRLAYLGLIFEKIDFNDEHRFSLPNKFFDYIKAGLPILSSKADEIKKIIDQFNIGTFIEDFVPAHIAKQIIQLDLQPGEYNLWKQNLITAAEVLNWENEEKKLVMFMEQLK